MNHLQKETIQKPRHWQLGGYSNDPATSEAEEIAARGEVKRDVGDYVLTLHEKWPMWTAERKDGKPLHKSLRGLWKDVASFRQKVGRLD